MDQSLQNALISGVDRVAAWSDLLDDINVFPIADGDTGRNLIASLTPLRQLNGNCEQTIQQLLMSARGNSGNIATRFFSGLLTADSAEILSKALRLGRDAARKAVNDPVPGTMLTLFDALVEFVENEEFKSNQDYVERITKHLEKTVQSTPNLLPILKSAGVVDSGALGMYVFLEGFFHSLIDRADQCIPITTRFKGMLQIKPSFKEQTEEGYCVDVVIKVDGNAEEKMKQIALLGESTVIIPHNNFLKVHLHTKNPVQVRQKIEEMGQIVNWEDDDLAAQIKSFKKTQKQGKLHILTDAAGSLTRENSHELGFSLLDSYIVTKDKSLPETLFSPKEIYEIMRRNQKISTSQASTYERHQSYQRVLEQYGRVLYLCVGSVFTGNYDVACNWKKQNDKDNRFIVLDTAAASGRLAVIVMATVRYAAETDDPSAVIEFAQKAMEKAEEYVFLDKLKYLAAGGRLSKSSAFFGDMLSMKPIVSPLAEGAKKVGIARNQKAQLKFAFERLKKTLSKDSKALILLEYSDNRSWVESEPRNQIKKMFPAAEIILQPLSLTSGVHMGPGTWALAFIPQFDRG
ncbi:DegV family EDD domain-containing protein [bacterium]|nr:DegV family EDD domain-containing protein [bacterium]